MGKNWLLANPLAQRKPLAGRILTTLQACFGGGRFPGCLAKSILIDMETVKPCAFGNVVNIRNTAKQKL